MKRTLQMMLLALVAIMMPIGAWAQLQKQLKLYFGVATLYQPFDVELDENTSAYVVTDVKINEDGSVQLVEEELPDGKIPALTAVILRNSQQPQEITLKIISELEPFITEEANLLKGTLVPISLNLSRETGNFALLQDITDDYPGFNDWQAPVGADGETKYTFGANKAYLDLTGKLDQDKIAELKKMPHLQHTHGGCEICRQVTEVSWGTTADALTSYGTLAEAVAAAGEEDSNIGYIKLLADVESTDGYTIEGADFTLDLNGQTIASENITLNIKSSTVTIEDNSEVKEGKVITSEIYAVSVDDGASVTINEGTYESTDFIALNVEGENSSVTINGGSYESPNVSISIFESCFVTITGGNFTSQASHAISTFGNLFINGGNFISAEEYENIVYDGGKITFSEYDGLTSITVSNGYGEKIVPSAETILLPEGYCFFYSNDVVSTLANGVGYSIGVEPEKYTVTFEANGGEGEMEGDNIYEGVDYTLPECTFTAPEGMMFKAWQIGEKECQPYQTVTIEDNTAIKALWTAYVPQITIKMHDSNGDGWHGDAIVVKKNGEEIETATIEDVADGIVRYDYDKTAEYTFYWQYTEQDNRWPRECSFEIFIDDEEVFAADNDKCYDFVDGDLIYTIEVEELTIADGELTEYSNDASFTTVGTLTYTRTLPNQMWNSLYVPFEIEVTEELLEDYELAYANNFHAYDSDDNGEIDDLEMEIIKIKAGTLHANYPYFIRAKSEEAQELTLTMEDATLYATKEQTITCQSFYTSFSLTGTYNRMYSEEFDNADGQCYAISTEGIWQPIAEGAYLNPFRVYMTITDLDNSPVKVDEEALARVRIRVAGEDSETGIDEVETENGATEIYDLSGRRVAQPQKGGIYIVNGKKVVL